MESVSARHTHLICLFGSCAPTNASALQRLTLPHWPRMRLPVLVPSMKVLLVPLRTRMLLALVVALEPELEPEPEPEPEPESEPEPEPEPEPARLRVVRSCGGCVPPIACPPQLQAAHSRHSES